MRARAPSRREEEIAQGLARIRRIRAARRWISWAFLPAVLAVGFLSGSERAAFGAFVLSSLAWCAFSNPGKCPSCNELFEDPNDLLHLKSRCYHCGLGLDGQPPPRDHVTPTAVYTVLVGMQKTCAVFGVFFGPLAILSEDSGFAAIALVGGVAAVGLTLYLRHWRALQRRDRSRP